MRVVAGTGSGGFAVGAACCVLVGCSGLPQPEPQRPVSPVEARLRAAPAPIQLVGLHPEAADALLGAPELARTERQAQYRRYEVDGCAVDLYLYDDSSNGTPKVAWFEVRPIDPLMAFDKSVCAWLEERLAAPSEAQRRAAALQS